MKIKHLGNSGSFKGVSLILIKIIEERKHID